jgi:hypothetical protein
MSKDRSKLSKRNPWYIPEYRYLELKYFCLQYRDYKRKYQELTYHVLQMGVPGAQKDFSDPTGEEAIRHDAVLSKIKVIENAAILCDPALAEYIITAVTEDRPYEYLSTLKQIPCSRNTFYDRRRRFFYILDSML